MNALVRRAEPVVEPRPHQRSVSVDVPRVGEPTHVGGHVAATEVVVEILDLGRPRAAQISLDPAAERPTGAEGRVGAADRERSADKTIARARRSTRWCRRRYSRRWHRTPTGCRPRRDGHAASCRSRYRSAWRYRSPRARRWWWRCRRDPDIRVAFHPVENRTVRQLYPSCSAGNDAARRRAPVVGQGVDATRVSTPRSCPRRRQGGRRHKRPRHSCGAPSAEANPYSWLRAGALTPTVATGHNESKRQTTHAPLPNRYGPVLVLVTAYAGSAAAATARANPVPAINRLGMRFLVRLLLPGTGPNQRAELGVIEPSVSVSALSIRSGKCGSRSPWVLMNVVISSSCVMVAEDHSPMVQVSAVSRSVTIT